MTQVSSEDARDQVRSRLNLVDVVRQHVRLRKQGREWVGLCPFHQEKSPSFAVNEQKQSWFCFGCDRGGDIFTFVQLIEKVEFPEALRILAEMGGIEIAERSGAAQDRSRQRRRLIEMNRIAAQYYEYVLHNNAAGEPGRELLARRGVTEETARRFGLGYAPGGSSFAAFVRKRGFSIKDAGDAHLVRRGDQDFFQHRLLIPIRDERGAILAFTGRTVRDDEKRKYMNTAETAAYIKGRVLFALDLAKGEIAERGHVVLMEGQFDVIAGHQHGVGNAVASSGTALTPEQLILLRRFTDEVVLMFDNDAAGRRAAAKAVALAAEHGLRTRVARLAGEAKDPDDYLRGGGSWDEVLRAARPGWETLIRDEIEPLNVHSPADREVGVRRIRQVLAQIRDPAEKDTYARAAGDLFEIEPRLLLAVDKETKRPAAREAAAAPASSSPAPPPPPAPTRRLSARLGYLLQLLAARPEAVDRVVDMLDPLDLLEDDRDAYQCVVEAIRRGGEEGLGREVDALPAEVQGLVRKTWVSPPPVLTDAAFDEVLGHLRRDAARRRHRDVQRQLSEAEQRGDRERVAALELQLRDLSERIPGLETKVG